MKKLTTKNSASCCIIFFFCLFFSTHLLAQITDSSRTTGTELKTFYSKILGEKRKISIQTPSKMNAFDHYPVLYVLDGEAQAVLAGGQVKYLTESYKIIPDMIVVGIENTDRMRDLTPTRPAMGPDGKPDTSSSSPFKTTGGGEKFLQFIKEELIPYVETQYPAAPYRILAGHSLGGLMALYCLLQHPDYFNAYIAISPSLQWDENKLLKQIPQQLSNGKLVNKLLFFSDANEDAAFHQNQLVLDSILQQKHPAGLSYKRLFYPEETHISEPVKAFYDGIRFVYPEWHLPYNSSAFRKTVTSKMIIDHYAALSKQYGYKVIPLHDEANMIARFLRNDPNRIKDAIELLEMNAVNYPSSPVVFETLGDTWMKTGDKNKAIANYEKALSLDQKNKQLEDKIKNAK
jgi:predicted alpha/beta superfamily hydrolase